MNQSNLPATQNYAAASATPASPEIVQAEPALTLFEILLRNKLKMILCVVIALGLGVYYQLTTDKVFQSTAEIFIKPTKDGQHTSPLSSGGLSVGQPSTHARLLESMPVLIETLKAPAVAESQTMATIEGEGRQLRHLKKKLSVGYSKESEVVTVSFMSKVPDDTKTVLDTVLASYLAELDIDVAHAEPGPAREAAGGSRGVMDEEMLASRLMKLSEELTSAEVALEAAEIRVDEAQQSQGDLATLSSLLAEAGLNAQVHGLAEIAYLKAELARLDQQLEGMPSGWGPEHKVRAPVQRQADALRLEIASLTRSAQTTMVGLLASSRKSAAERVSELNTRIAIQQEQAQSIASMPVDIYQWPYVPTKKIAPRGIKTMGIALFLGLFAGMMLTLWGEMKKPAAATVKTVKQAAQNLAVEVRDTTGYLNGHAANGAASLALPLMKGEDLAAGSDEADNAPLLGMVPEVPAGSRLTSPNFDATASSIHQIRAVLQVQARSSDMKAYAFTSPRRGAGKTSVAIGVASSLAMSGTRTLVVDCDLAGRISRGQTGAPTGQDSAKDPSRKESAFHDRFGPIDDEGSSAENASLDNIVIEQGYLSEDDTEQLATNTTGQVGIAAVLDGAPLQDSVVKATVSGLWLLPAIHAQTRHIGKMSDAFIRDVIDQAKDHYDLVLFDTGPVPGSVEALLVTSQANGVILVVPQGESRQALDRTMSYLKVVGATVTGTVFNRVAEAKPPQPSNPGNSSVGGATAAAAAAGAIHRNGEPVNDEMLVELEKEQAATDDDGEYLAGDAPLGSGILAAAVFSDAESEYESKNWKLEETSGEFNGSVEELFGKVNGETNDATPDSNGHA